MTAYSRILATGSNKSVPRVAHLPCGVGVDGAVFRYPVELQPDEELCPVCKGHGDITYGDINPSVRPWSERCGRCDGRGIITIELDELDEPETAAVFRCLPAAAAGRSPNPPGGGRLSHTGMTPASRATGDLSRTKLKTHHVLRSVQQHPALHSPASVNAPARAPGISTIDMIVDGATVIAGLTVFSAIAWFFLVLA